MKKSLLAILLVACLSYISKAKTIYVDASATGTGDGTTWVDSYTDLQVAIYNAVSGDEVWVKSGVYNPSINTSGILPSTVETRTFWLKNNVEVYGGFNGTETQKSERDAINNKAVLDGDMSNNKFAYSVLTVSANNTATLDGFVVTNGKAVGSGSYSYGGGLNLTGGANFVNVEFVNNTALFQGGAVYANTGSSSRFVSCRFENNVATTYDGGAAYLNNSDLEFYNCVFFKNSAARFGGVLTSVSSNALLQNSTIVGNTGGSNVFQLSNTGGGPWAVTVNNSILWGNVGTSAGVQSGASIVYSNSLSQWGCTTCINSDPLFNDQILGDLSLTETSPAIDTLSASVDNSYNDIIGNARVFGTSADLGAYEYGASLALSSIIYVDKDATGLNNGESWADAYTDLQHAIRFAKFGDDIWVKEGVYYPTINTSGAVPAIAERTFWLKNNVRVLGGFVGNETQVDQRDVYNHKATLDGLVDGNSKVNHVLTVSSNSSSELDGFIVQNGAAPASETTGGGLLLYGNAKFSNIVFLNNTAYQQGGGLYASGSSSEFVNCRFEGNSAITLDGGAAYLNSNSDIEFSNCVFYNNSAPRFGGVLVTVNSNATFQNCTVAKNTGTNNVFQASHTTGGPWKISINESVMWGNVGTYVGTQAGASLVATNSLSQWGCTSCVNSDPLFVDINSGDLSLLDDSPAIDNVLASATSNYDNDIDGNQRLVGTTVDYGAFENQGLLVGATDRILTSELLVYPNPTQDRVTLSTGSVNWVLRTSTGVELLSGYGSKINLSNLPKGIYIAEMLKEEGRVISKIIKN